MSDPFGDLERELMEHVRASRPPRRRLARRRSAWLFAAIALGVGGAGAAAAGALHRGDARRARSLSQAVTEQVGYDGACAVPAHPSRQSGTTDVAILPVFADRFPWLRAPQSRAAQARASRLMERVSAHGRGRIVRGTPHAARMADGTWTVIWVQQGDPMGTVEDPVSCLALRMDALARRAAEASPRVQALARRLLVGDPMTSRATQTLYISHLFGAHCGPASPTRCVGGTGGASLVPGAVDLRRVPAPGLLGFSVGGPIGSVYHGLAHPETSRIELRAEHPHRIASARHHLVLTHRFWSVVLPRGSGAVTLVERDRVGREVNRVTLRSRLPRRAA